MKLSLYVTAAIVINLFHLSKPALPYLAALILGALRLGGETGQTFQAVAHLYLGGLIWGAYVTKESRTRNIVLAVLLSVLEVVAFTLSRL